MKKLVLALVLAVGLSACALTEGMFGPTPEAQIITGVRSVTAATTLASALLKNNRITVAQAKGYSGLLHTAGDHLKTANATLEACRKSSRSTSATLPDPCAPTVASDIGLAVSVVSEVQKVLGGK